MPWESVSNREMRRRQLMRAGVPAREPGFKGAGRACGISASQLVGFPCVGLAGLVVL
jgi:hypothetical protein